MATPSAALRPLPLPADCPGALWLTAMPGRFGTMAEFAATAASHGIGHVLCLAGAEEVAVKSPDYATALAAGSLPLQLLQHPITDFGIPDDTATFADWIATIAARLAAGERMAMHCAAGIGRTGTAAICLLRHLGVAREEAERSVLAAGSGPETEAQKAFAAAFTPRRG